MLPHFTIYQPSAWDNSLTPIQILHKIINNLNVVVDYVNQIQDTGFERAKEYTDEQITIVNNSIDATNAEIERVNNDVQTNIRSINHSLTVLTSRLNALSQNVLDLSNRESSHYNEITQELTNVYSRINQTATQLRAYADLKDFYLKQQIEDEINELRVVIDNILNVKTIDGYTGNVKTVRQCLGTHILYKSKTRGANRYAMTWGQLKTNTRNGFLAHYSIRMNSRINYIAPTWHNLKLNNYTFTNTSNLYSNNLNNWGAFCNLTLLFLGDMVHKINYYCTSSTQAIADNYKSVDVFKKSEWDAYISDGLTPPTVERVDVTEMYDGTNTHASLILSQFKLSLAVITGAVAGYGLYASSGSNSLFSSTSDLPALFQFLQGNLNTEFYSDTFFE